MSLKLFDSTFGAIQKALDLRFRRHQLLASNAANNETPNYRARELDFAGELQRATGQKSSQLLKTNPMHMDLSGSDGAHIVFDNTGAMGTDGNNVDLDINMGKISANAREYTNAATMLSLKIGLLRNSTRLRGGA